MIVAEKCYVRPNDFIPERWSSSPELIRSKNAYAPFSLGKLGSLLSMPTVRSLHVRDDGYSPPYF